MISGISFLYLISILLGILNYDKPDMLVIKSFDEVVYENSVLNVEDYAFDGIKSMILPHHLLAADKIAKMYSTASSDSVERILLISPDHFTNSGRKVLTSRKSWLGPYGMVKADKEFINTLLSFDFIYEDDKEIESEHGINSHIPYISEYFKNARVIPLAITKEASIIQLMQIVDLLDGNTMVIASVDFSHYFTLSEADYFDEKTKGIIVSKDYDSLWGLSDAYYDSPGALFTVFSFAEKMGYETYFIDHGNSAYYTSVNMPETTSYFFIGFK